MGDGWYGSSFTWHGEHYFTGPDGLLAQLEVSYNEGSSETFATDGSWKADSSPILHSEIYSGETYDARLLQPNWDHPGFNDSRWSAADISTAPANLKVAASASASRAKVVMTLQPKSFSGLPDGSYVFDMGQNMVGWVKLSVNGPAGTTVRLRYAEILNPDGTLYRQNLRNADATDKYTLRGKGTEEYSPYFTFHGFRYVEVRGYPGMPGPDAIEGRGRQQPAR